MVSKDGKLQFETVDIVIRFTKGTGSHKRLVEMMAVTGMSASDFIKSQIDRAYLDLVEWQVCNGKR